MTETYETNFRTQRRPRLDRRDHPRRRLSMHVTGRRLDPSMEARREPFLYLSIRDISVGGLCGISQTRVRVGEHLAVFFPPEGASRGWDAYGRVLRSEPDHLGWRVGMILERVAAI